MACKVFTAAGVVFPSGVESARAAEVGSLYIVSIHQRWVYPTIAEGHRVNLSHIPAAVPGKPMQLETVAHAPRLFKVRRYCLISAVCCLLLAALHTLFFLPPRT
jgi:hypothetical protein